MVYIEGTKADTYRSSAAMGSSCQELSNGLLLDKVGYTVLKTDNFVSWHDLENSLYVRKLTDAQQSAINHYRAKYSLSSELYFIVLSTGEENLNPLTKEPDPTQYTLKGNVARKILEAYNKHRYDFSGEEKNSFEFLNNFVHKYLENKKLEIPHPQLPSYQIKFTVDKVYLWSIPHTETKPLRINKRGSRGRGKRK